VTRLRATASGRRLEGLSAEASALWLEITAGWELGPDGEAILRQACEALDRLREAQRILREEGLVVQSARGALRAHPAVRIEVEARRALLAALAQLRLEGADEIRARFET
jgi:P27 family predicted phage terminase small subunit